MAHCLAAKGSWRLGGARTQLRGSWTAGRPATILQAAAASTAASSVRILDERTAPEKLRDVTTMLFDCDGVLWRGNEIIHHAPEALRELRRQGKRVLFITNNSSKSRVAYTDKFRGLGLDVEAHEIVSSSYCAAAYLTSVGGFGPGGKKVLLLGWTGVEEELTAAGINFVGGRHLPLPHMDNIQAMMDLRVDPDIGAVVVGWDPNFSYSRLVYASIHLRELPGCLLVATNTDHADHIGPSPTGHARMMPGTGGLVAAIEVTSGVKAINVAKGGPWLLPYLLSKYGFEASRTAIVGDRLDTDIHLGKEGGLVTCLPLTGVTTMAALEALPEAERPDLVVPSVAALAGLQP